MLQEAAEDAAGENSDYEPQDPDAEMDDGLGIGDDLVPFVNGRLDDEDEPCAEEISGPSNEPSPEVSGHPGNARAEQEDSNAEQATLEVSGHADNAGAEKEDSVQSNLHLRFRCLSMATMLSWNRRLQHLCNLS